MPDYDGESDKLYYIHLENLPWSASHNDVHQFFDGIAIPVGGISIYCNDAFIVVTTKEDFKDALQMSGQKIHGTPVYLTSTIKQEVFRRKCRFITRKLNFLPSVRRIRPTFISDNSKDMYNVFNPTETDVSDDYKDVNLQQPNKGISKKIRPTLIKDLTQLQVFEESESESVRQCVKKMKLADNWLLSHLDEVSD